MPEGWGGGGKGLQNDGDEKRQEVQGRERRKKDGSREDGWSEEGLKGVTLIHKAMPKKTKKAACVGWTLLFPIQALKCRKEKQQDYIFLINIVISQAQI